MTGGTRTVRVLGAAVGIAVASVLALTGCSDGAAAPRVSSSAHSTDTTSTPRADPTSNAADVFSILRRPVTADDALPETDLTTEPEGMVPNSARLAVEHDGTKYWIAALADGGACLIAWTGEPDSAGEYSVCGGGQDLHRAAVVTSMIDEQDHQTVLATDGYTSTGANPLQELAPNVWVSAPGD